MGSLKGSKTYLVAGLAVLGAVVSFLVGDLAAADAIQLALTAVLGATVRNAIK